MCEWGPNNTTDDQKHNRTTRHTCACCRVTNALGAKPEFDLYPGALGSVHRGFYNLLHGIPEGGSEDRLPTQVNCACRVEYLHQVYKSKIYPELVKRSALLLGSPCRPLTRCCRPT